MSVLVAPPYNFDAWTIGWARPAKRRIAMESEVKEQAVLWRWLDGSGIEHCRISEGATPTLAGMVLVRSGDMPWRIEYEVRCDDVWRTRAVTIHAQADVTPRSLTLKVDEQTRWRVSEEERPDLNGCLDVDLGFSPSTNTLPIRRLRLGVQQSASIDAAWVEFPSLAVRRLPQRYTRLDEYTYRYENGPSGFSAELTVDPHGLILAYPPGWERVDRSEDASPLFSNSSSAELGDAVSLYRGLIGRWDIEVIDYEDDGTRRTSQGEWHFGWALEGRAVQDVFIVPARTLRPGAVESRRGNRYGTTVRFYDPTLRAWRIVWVNPVSGAVNSLTARVEGDAIVQEGTDSDGSLIRWSFVEIGRSRFHWVGEKSTDAGRTWQTRAEFFGRRASFAQLR
jgi:hypothetical protein